jgi:hypothetical protein
MKEWIKTIKALNEPWGENRWTVLFFW